MLGALEPGRGGEELETSSNQGVNITPAPARTGSSRVCSHSYEYEYEYRRIYISSSALSSDDEKAGK